VRNGIGFTFLYRNFMKKNYKILLGILLGLIVISTLINKKRTPWEQVTVVSTWVDNQYTIGWSLIEQWQVYGMVVATNGATIIPSVGWILQSASCEPWQEIKKWDVVAVFAPAQDLQTLNMWVQQNYLWQQVGVLQSALSSSLQNVDIQIALLKDQKATNEKQLTILQQNLENAQQQKSLTSWDTQIQLASLKTQLLNVKDQEKADITKTQDTLKNQLNAAQTTALWAATLVNNNFGIVGSAISEETKPYLGAKDVDGKSKVISQYVGIKSLIDWLMTVSWDVASENLQQIAGYFSLAAQVINNSISDARFFPQSKLDSLFTTFNTTASSVILAKTNYDTAWAANTTVRATYNTQITTLENQIATMTDNRTKLNDISNDTQINALETQINNLELSINSFDNQLASLENSKDTQTQSTNQQLLSTQQNLQQVSNTLNGETLYSPIDGIVKTSSVVVWMKFSPTSAVCTIGPKTVDWLKIQFFSTKIIQTGQIVYIYDWVQLLGTWEVANQTIYVDPQTQNRWYEIFWLEWNLFKEWQKTTIRFDNTPASDEVRVPLPFITPKLDGYYVSKKTYTWQDEIKIQVWDIDGWNIRVLSGLQYGDVVVR